MNNAFSLGFIAIMLVISIFWFSFGGNKYQSSATIELSPAFTSCYGNASKCVFHPIYLNENGKVFIDNINLTKEQVINHAREHSLDCKLKTFKVNAHV